MHAETPPPPPPDDDDIREVQHFATILRAYDNYLPWARRRLRRLADDYARLGAPHRAALRLDEKLEAMRRAAEANGAAIARLVAPHRSHVGSDVLHMFVLADDGRGGVRATAAAAAAYVPESDMEKVQSTLKQCVREWGEEGEEERREAHTPLLTALRETVPVRGGEARVLLPGAGLGRLAWEVARLGYKAQGCEFSYFMLLASNFIMNGLGGERVVIHPWVLQTCNTRSIEDAVRPAEVPAVSPAELEATCNLSMCAGDFLEIYREQRSRWEAIVTCFFIDTAHDVTRYIERIAAMLVPGAVWINLGPLLWHWSDMSNEVSVDLTWEELRALIVAFGFVIEQEEWRMCKYTRNLRSMYRMEYECIFFVARLPAATQ